MFTSATAVASLHAQKNAAFAITGPQKGSGMWAEVRMVDITSGDEVKSIYQSKGEYTVLNARTKKEVVATDVATGADARVASRKPFATMSAACAYDKKHERLYYTPMGIAELRYIDLKSKTPKIYYFEGETFGALKSPRDVPNQITRMVMGADGEGYALTNDANHLIQFTTNKRAVIRDLGALTDAASNGTMSIHSQHNFGGDMIADAQNNLYLVGANHSVYKIDLSSRVATYLGSIQGLPRGYSTNGAMVEEDAKVIVCSSGSTQGYYRFDLETLQAEQVSTGAVYNASDLANGNLAFEKKKKGHDLVKEEPKVVDNPPTTVADTRRSGPNDLLLQGAIAAYPNPVTNGVVKLSFDKLPEGRYQVQFMEIDGRIVRSQVVTLKGTYQQEEFKLPSVMAGGNYLIKVINEQTKASAVTQLVVQ